jgi:hypothetical protein
MSLKNLIGRINFISGQQETGRTLRRMSLQTAALLRGPVGRARSTLEGIAETAARVEREAASWAGPDAMESGGPFDACDLRHWLLLAERAGVSFVPAREVLSLSEAELSAIDQKLQVPEFISGSIAKGLKRALPELEGGTPSDEPRPDPAEVHERLFTAMEGVPYDWMVRTNISGSSMLKSLAGTGLIGDGREGATLAEGVEVGAGWVRVGNRPRIDATDRRFVETFMSGHKDRLHYLARPWVTAARYGEAEDPHRHGSQFAGKGRWPMEWRCFVEGGRVTGVASYYGWVGEVTPENAARALEAAEAAQRIVDAGLGLDLSPRWMDVELLRFASEEALSRPHLRETLDRFPADGFACTLDFIETEHGMTLLEGGPPHTPIGGGHPCAFAGFGTRPNGACRTDGVALRLIDGVCLGDPKSWMGRDNDGSVLSWDEARELAGQVVPETEDCPCP